MLATEVLTAHHRVIRGLVRRLEETPLESRDDRNDVLDALMAELDMHDQIEEKIFYPAMLDASMVVLVAHAEQRQISDQLAVLLRTDISSERFSEELRVLAARLEHHIGTEEEGRMFPEVVRKVDASQLEAIGECLEARLKQLRSSRLSRLRLRLKRAALRRS